MVEEERDYSEFMFLALPFFDVYPKSILGDFP